MSSYDRSEANKIKVNDVQKVIKFVEKLNGKESTLPLLAHSLIIAAKEKDFQIYCLNKNKQYNVSVKLVNYIDKQGVVHK